jgi:hypothetical protein
MNHHRKDDLKYDIGRCVTGIVINENFAFIYFFNRYINRKHAILFVDEIVNHKLSILLDHVQIKVTPIPILFFHIICTVSSTQQTSHNKNR